MSTPLLIEREASDEVRAVFDALIAFMGDTWVNVNAYASEDPSGAKTCGITAYDAAGNQFTYSERIVGPRVMVEPASVTLGPGATQQFTAAVVDAQGNPITGTFTWSLLEGGTGTLSPSGFYTAPATINASSTSFVTAVDTVSGASATATVGLNP